MTPMIDIQPMQPEQVEEARHVIYATAHQLFDPEKTYEEACARYAVNWPLADISDYQHKYVENGGVFLVLCEGDHIIGTGALKKLEDGVAEVKRLWLLPEYQGRGLGYRMMNALITEARARGYTTLRLETSPAYQQRAYSFYRKFGFHDIPRYGDDPDDVGMEMDI